MMMRKLLIVISVLLALLVAAAVVAMLVIDPDDYRDEIAQRASDQLGREVRLDGPMSLKFFPWLAIEISDVGVGNPPDFGEAPALARVGSAIASVRVWPLIRDRELEFGAITLEDAEFHLVTDRAGRSNLDGLLAETDPEVERAEPDLGVLALGQIRLRDVRLVNLDQQTGESQAFRIDSMNLAPFRAAQPVAFDLTASLLDGDDEVVRLSSLSGTVEVARNLSSLRLQGLVGEVVLPAAQADGRIQADVELVPGPTTTTARLTDFQARLSHADLALMIQATTPMEVETGAHGTRARFDQVTVRINDDRLSASGRLELAPAINAELDLVGERLDLRRLIPDAPEREHSPNGAEAPVDFTILHDTAARLSLQLGTLVVSDALRLDEVEARARLEDGVLELSPLEARLFGGRFDGRVEVDFTTEPPRVVVQPALSGILVDQVAELSGRTAPVRGSGDMRLDLSFSGFELDEILGSLDGSGNFSVAEGALIGVDVRELISQELTVSNLGNVSRAFGGETRFDTFGGTMTARSGVIEIPDLNLAASDYGMSGRGTIDLAAGLVEYRLELQLGETLTAQLPRTLRQATDGRIPLAITGPIREPTVMVDVAGIAEQALRGQIEQRLLRSRRDRDSEPEPQADTEEGEEGEQGDAETGTEPLSEQEDAPRTRDSERLLRGLLERIDKEVEEEEDEEPIRVDP
jgi:AsmA protein